MKVGDKLANGATVMAFKESGSINPLGERKVVLAFTDPDAATPYVTWRYNKDNGGDTYWGHYFKTANEAWNDFNERW